nr:MAG TPA: hypothetical protein [Caudoviricetes sp.]
MKACSHFNSRNYNHDYKIKYVTLRRLFYSF